jgi:uncharacterized protein (DUF2235 family)
MTSDSKFAETVCEAYRFLSDHYETENCIFLFGEYVRLLEWELYDIESNVRPGLTGFSRGAYQARVLSAMIDIVYS